LSAPTLFGGHPTLTELALDAVMAGECCIEAVGLRSHGGLREGQTAGRRER
jgi:hypothetical protein